VIGGYIYRRGNPDIAALLENELVGSIKKIVVWDDGYFFYGNSFKNKQATHLVLEDIVVLSNDLLVTLDSDGEYRLLNLEEKFPEMLRKDAANALNAIPSDFRMAVTYKIREDKFLFLVSNRAGAGRMYFHTLETGILFCSDLRFLFKIIQPDVRPIGVYSILKYGGVPEPLTIGHNISAVPPAHYLKYHLNNGKYSMQPYFKFRFTHPDSDVLHVSEGALLKPVKDNLQRSSRFLRKQNPAILLSGGIDSSLYASYLAQGNSIGPKAFYCAFGEDDPEIEFAQKIADQIHADFHVVKMEEVDAFNTVEDAARLTDHPFSDFSSLPIVFLLKHMRGCLSGSATIIECNGGDDCFGFQDLANQKKFDLKHQVPRFLKRIISSGLRNHPYWKWESHEGPLARLSAMADAYENTSLNYFLVLTPVRYLRLQTDEGWDEKLQEVMESVFSACGEDYKNLGYMAKTTIRQLLHVNSRRWAAKALSVGESLGLRVVYPYLWHEILVEQGQLPWSAKIHDGVVKWPLKKLLEEFMPKSFIYRKKSGFVPPFARWLTDRDFNHKVRDILMGAKGYTSEIVPTKTFDELLSDAMKGKRLRHSILNFLWAAVFTEVWLQKNRR